MTISLLHPSRGRPKKALETFNNWLNKSSGTHKIEHILAIDNDDPELSNYKALDFGNSWTVILSGNHGCAVAATNRAADISHGEILVMLSDDFDCPEHWDTRIVEAMAGHEGCVLKTFDGLQKWIVTLAIMDRAYYNLQGHFYFPQYKHMFCDTDMTHKAELEGRLIIRNDIVFPHNHYSQGKSKKDNTSERADATWNQGEAIYLRRIKGLMDQGVDVFALSPEAIPSIQWLKSKLRVAA